MDRPPFRSSGALRAALLCALTALTLASCDCGTPPAVNDGGADAGGGCPVGTEGCACSTSEPACATDLACRNGECQPCAFGTLGCPCPDKTCQGNDVCDTVSGTCREPTDCEMAGCAQHQLCRMPDAGDAVCLEECEEGYSWNGTTRACDATPSCDENAPGYLDCASDGRVCDDSGLEPVCGGCLDTHVEINGACVTNDCAGIDCEGRFGRSCSESEAGPVCGDCLATHVYDPDTDNCVDRRTCAETSCGDGEFCVEATPTTDASCEEAANCPTGQVKNLATGQCVPCTNCYDANAQPFDGVTGIGYSGFSYGNICVCQVEEGWFQNLSTGTVTQCDADGDGWVTDLLLPVLTTNGGDNPLADEQKCDVRSVDRFVLQTDDASEPGVRATRTVTVQEVVDAFQLPTSAYLVDAAGQAFIELFEPAILDDPARFLERYEATGDPRIYLKSYAGRTAAPPSPGDGGVVDGGGAAPGAPPPHHLAAAEVNPLTKTCNHDDDDLNLDSVPDVEQSQVVAGSPFGPNAQILKHTPVLYRMSYFLELNRSYWQSRTAECGTGPTCHGAYVIAEKSRSALDTDPMDLELTYPDGAGTYWQTCVRGRNPNYEGISSAPGAGVGSDFAYWHEACDTTTGPCQVSGDGRPAHVPYDGRTPQTPAANYDAPADDLPNDGGPRWLGMNHHSQFKCVTFRTEADVVTQRRPPSGHDYVLQTCELGARAFDPPPAGADATNPLDPELTCIPATSDTEARAASTLGFNHWIALGYERYTNTNDYEGGCIEEATEWGSFLCVDTPGTNDPTAFGQLYCGCDDNRGGVDCEIGCPPMFRHAEPTYSGATRDGYWMCASPSLAAPVPLSDPTSGYTLRGKVPLEATPLEEHCETVDGGPACGQGYRLRPAPVLPGLSP